MVNVCRIEKESKDQLHILHIYIVVVHGEVFDTKPSAMGTHKLNIYLYVSPTIN